MAFGAFYIAHLLTIRTIEPLQALHSNYSKMVCPSIPTHIKNPDALSTIKFQRPQVVAMATKLCPRHIQDDSK